VTVEWAYWLNGSVYNATTLIANATSVNEPGPWPDYSVSLVNSASFVSVDADPFTSDVTVNLEGVYSTTCTETATLTIPVPTCTLEESHTYNADDGTITVGWQFLKDLVPSIANTVSGVANAVSFPLETESFTVNDTSDDTWAPGQTFSSDVDVTLDGNEGVCVAPQLNFKILREKCAGDIEFYDSLAYDTLASYYDVPLWTPATVNSTSYVQVYDCDENEDRSLVDTVKVTLISNTPWSDPYDTVNTTLVETDANSGVFTNTVTLTRGEGLADTLDVEPGSIIDGDYQDNDDILDTDMDTLGVTGARELRIVDALGVDIEPPTQLDADGFPYDPSYPDGDSAFHVELNMPAFANNGGPPDTVAVQTCARDWMTWELYDTHSVTLIEDAADNGMMRVDNVVSYATDYVYIGADDATGPTPGGDTDVGLRIENYSRIEVIYPYTDATCDYGPKPDYQNLGYSDWVEARACERSIAINDSESGGLEWSCLSENRTDTGLYDDYYAKYYDFTSGGGDFQIDVASSMFDAYVYLINSTGGVVNGVDDGGMGTNARLIKTGLAAGDYTIEVTSNTQWEMGEFTVALSSPPPTPLPSIVPPGVYDFETGLQGWSTSATGVEDWHQTTRSGSGLTNSVHYGQEANPLPGYSSYDTGINPNSGTLTSPGAYSIGPLSSLSFDYSLGNECSGWPPTGDLCGPWDQLDVEISDDGATWTSLTGDMGLPETHNDGTPPAFWLQGIPLGAYDGMTLMIRFSFDTRNDSDNDHEGAYVDNVKITP
jgi:hypothetical protein